MGELLEISTDLGFLVIDDSQTFREAVLHSLKTLGFHNLYQGVNARAGITTLRENKIGFVICERHLRKTNGMEFLKEIRESRDIAHLPFIMMASEIPKDDVMLAAEFGIDGYLKKPFVLKDITQKISSALQHFRNPTNKEAVFENARISLQKDDYSGALKIYQDVLTLLPQSARALVGISKCLRGLRKYSEAEIILKEAIKKNSLYVHAYHELGIVYSEMKKVDDALYNFDKAISISPNNPLRYEAIADILMKNEKFGDAENYLRKAVKLELVYPELYAQLGKALFTQKKLDKALQYFEKALQDDPKNTSFLNSMGICKKEIGKFDDAIRYYNLALKEVPNDTKILFNKALCYYQMKEVERAKKICLQILGIDPTYEKAKQKLNEIKEHQNKPKTDIEPNDKEKISNS